MDVTDEGLFRPLWPVVMPPKMAPEPDIDIGLMRDIQLIEALREGFLLNNYRPLKLWSLRWDLSDNFKPDNSGGMSADTARDRVVESLTVASVTSSSSALTSMLGEATKQLTIARRSSESTVPSGASRYLDEASTLWIQWQHTSDRETRGLRIFTATLYRFVVTMLPTAQPALIDYGCRLLDAALALDWQANGLIGGAELWMRRA